jgi:hypothetical protein
MKMSLNKLYLLLKNYSGPSHWRWLLTDGQQSILDYWDVALDTSTREYRGYLNLSTYIQYDKPEQPPSAQLTDLGLWIGNHVFGRLRNTLWNHRMSPAAVVHVIVPPEAREMLSRPLELALFLDGTSFAEAGLRFVYQIENTNNTPNLLDKEPASKDLRVLVIFSLPAHTHPLNLRRERYELQQLALILKVKRGLHLRILQYGATRKALEATLEEQDGWDIIHFSGHGEKGTLLLVNERGDRDTVNADELGELLDPARSRLKLLILDTCYSGANTENEVNGLLQSSQVPAQQGIDDDKLITNTVDTTLPSLAEVLAQQLDCAVLAMRYPVEDVFATDLMISLYEKLLDRRRPLPAALNLAIREAVANNTVIPTLSLATPILVGLRAVDLRLSPPERPWERGFKPEPQPEIAFPPESQHFVGHTLAMVNASQVLAVRGGKNGVLFYGIPGSGKTACALELAYCHERSRFVDYIWYEVNAASNKIGEQLSNILRQIELHTEMEKGWLSKSLEDKELFRTTTLLQWRAYLKERSMLLVIDNLDPLLDKTGLWLDPMWGDFIDKLLTHDGLSRVILTARSVPVALALHPRLLRERISPLNERESVLLARQLPNLKRLFTDQAGRKLLRRTLRIAQGNPEVLNRADKCALDFERLDRLVTAAELKLAKGVDELDALFPDVCGTVEEKSWQLAIVSAVKENSLRTELDPVLIDLEAKGWRLRDPIHRIWDGERNLVSLTAGLEAQDRILIQRLLQELGQ